jgi:hypothetical protein
LRKQGGACQLCCWQCWLEFCLEAMSTAGRRVMPRYYFHLTNGTQVLDNHKGLDLPGDAAAREDAVVLARGLKHGAAMPGWDWAGWLVVISNEQGRQIDEIPIADV